MKPWDQTRASFAQERIGTPALAIGDEILFSDLILPAQRDRHYIVEACSLVGRCTVRAPLEPPVSGLFLVGSDTSPVGVPWAAIQRGMLLPLSACYCCEVALGAQFGIGYVMQPGFKITVPRNFTIRGIIQCGDGAPAGPGAGSTLLLRALVVEEPDCGAE
jgi:hypothetical protein